MRIGFGGLVARTYNLQLVESLRPLCMPPLDRKHVRVFRSHASADDGGYMPGTPEERLSQVWNLTQEVWLFFQGANAERRLQRDVAVLIRGKRFSVVRRADISDPDGRSKISRHW